MTDSTDTRWVTGNSEVDEWTASQHAVGKHSQNCPPGCRAAARLTGMAAQMDLFRRESARIKAGSKEHVNGADRASSPVGAATVAIEAEPPEPEPEYENSEEGFWSAYPVLGHIREFAYARMVAPWSMLGMVMLRCAHHIPHWWTLPPIIGGRGSLNLFVATVARSGGGKSSSEAAAEEAIWFDSPIGMYVSRLGSGEGLARKYAHHEKGLGVVMDRNAVLWTCGEVSELAALGGRRGATLLPELREAFTGGRLGFGGYAAADKAIQLEPHSYRLGLFLNVQTRLSGFLFDDTDAGTPQRFLWLPATDPDITADPPPAPSQMQIDLRFGSSMKRTLEVPDIATRTIREAHAARQRGEGDALDGHALFVRLKVAQVLAFLDGHNAMTDLDWHLAGIVAAVSDRTRARAQAQVQIAEAEKSRARGKAEGERQAVAADVVAERAIQRVAQRVRRLIRERPGIAGNDLRKAVASRDRQYLDEAVGLLVATGDILREEVNCGIRYRPGG